MISNSFNISVSGMRAAQKIIDVSSQNITNAATPGYKRQEVTTQEIGYAVQDMVNSYSGSGTQATVSTPAQPWVDYRYNNALQEKANADAQKTATDGVEQALSGSTVADAYNKFLSSASELQANSTSAVLKEQFNQAGKNLAQQMNQLSSAFTNSASLTQQAVDLHQQKLDSLRNTLETLTSQSNTKDVVTEINYLRQQISQETGTLAGYNAVLNKVIPPVTGLYDQVKETAVNNINSTYGQELFSTDSNGTISWNPRDGGNLDFSGINGNGQFSDQLGRLNVIVGSNQQQAADIASANTNALQVASESYNQAYGVDNVQESLNIKRAQQMYEANAQVINTQNQMFQTLMSIFV